MAERIFYTMGEVAEMFDVRTSLIRHWESQFPMLRPKRNKKGNRLFSPQDVEHLKMIYHLVKERGMTLEGAKKALRGGIAGSDVERDAELMERLQRIRSLLLEVREDLKAGAGEVVDAGEEPQEAAGTPGAAVSGPEASAPVRRRRARAVVKIDDAADATDAASAPVSESASGSVEKPVEESAEAPAEKVPGQPTRQTARKPRRKKEEVENKELFAFYEQSLF